MSLPADILDGRKLHGDDFTPEQIASWFEDEQKGYFNIVGARKKPRPYEYGALNDVHAYDYLRRGRYGTCLAIGCAWGDDVAPLAPVVDRYIAVEPARERRKARNLCRPAA